MSTGRLLFIWFFALLIKSGQLIYLSYLTQCSAPDRALGKLAFASGDTFSYTGAMEKYISRGTYFFHNGNREVYAGRMPHYSIPYFLFRQFADQRTAHDLVVLLQLLLEAIATVMLALLAQQIFKNIFAFWLALVISLISLNWTSLSFQISPESLSISFLVLFLYFFQKYLDLDSYKELIFSSISLAILTTLKAYFSLLFIAVGISIIYREYVNHGVKYKFVNRVMVQGLIMSVPLVILLMPWVVRNYSYFDRFVPLQENAYAGYNYTSSELALRRFITAWGGDIIHWEKTSAGCWFYYADENRCEFTFPRYAFTDEYNSDSLESIKSDFILLKSNYVAELDLRTTDRLNNYIESYKVNKPFRYYIVSPLLLAFRFIFNSGSYYLPIHITNPCYRNGHILPKIVQSLLYWTSVIFGAFGLILLTFKRKMYAIYLLTVLIIFIVFPFTLRIVEWRYLNTIMPLFMLGCVGLISHVNERLNSVN